MTAEADNYREIFGLTALEAARSIANDKLHVLIDLQGLTLHGSFPILAHRPAPVQMSLLGYSLSTGASFIDYFVSDAKAATTERAIKFSESSCRCRTCW